MKYTPRLPEDNPNYSKRSALRELLLLASGFAAVAVFAYVALGVAIDQIVKIAPERFETAMGEILKTTLASDPDFEKERERVQGIVNKLKQHIDGRVGQNYEVHIVDEPETVNAMAYPGGHIVLYTGLLKEVKTENELALVLGHELGHFVNRDHLQGLGRAFALSFLCSFFFNDDSLVHSFLRGSLQIAELRHSRGQEEKADAIGLSLLNGAYGHVGGATLFFERLAKKETELKAFAFLSTHPLSERRVDKLRGLIDKRGYLVRPPKKY